MILSLPIEELNLHSDTERLVTWDWFIDQDSKLLYQYKISSIWVVYPKRNHGHYSYEITSRVRENVPNEELLRATLSHLHDTIVVRNTVPRVDNSVEDDNIIVLDDIVMKNPKLDWLNSYMSCSNKNQLSYKWHHFWYCPGSKWRILLSDWRSRGICLDYINTRR